MSDPHRWIDDPATSNQLRTALQQYSRPAAIPAEALQALGTALRNASPSAASAAPSASMGAAVLTKAGLVAVAIGLSGAGWLALSSKTENAAPVTVTSVVVASPPANAAPAAVVPLSPADALGLVGQTAENAPTTRNVSEITPRKTKATATTSVARRSPDVRSEPERSMQHVENAKPDKSQLQQEATLLERGRKSLSTDPKRALEQTALHRERFAKPMLGFERDLIEMDALCRLGNTAQAESIANNLLQAQPAGPYAERARAILARAKRGKSLEGVKDRGSLDNQ